MQTRKFKGLKKRRGEDDGAESEGAQSEGGEAAEKPLSGGGGEGRKRKKV
jgi:hypothetical protein